MLESAEKDIKRIITTVLHLFKMFDRDIEDTTSPPRKKARILGVNLVKDVQDHFYKKLC